MSKPRYRWWGFACRMIRDYRGLKAEYEDLHTQTITADTSGMPREGGTGRAVEAIALRQLPKDDQEVYDAVTRAIEITRLRPDGEERINMIRFIYWNRKQHRLRDAALHVHISEPTAKRWHGDFVRLVGSCYGFTVDTNKPKE